MTATAYCGPSVSVRDLFQDLLQILKSTENETCWGNWQGVTELTGRTCVTSQPSQKISRTWLDSTSSSCQCLLTTSWGVPPPQKTSWRWSEVTSMNQKWLSVVSGRPIMAQAQHLWMLKSMIAKAAEKEGPLYLHFDNSRILWISICHDNS